jgi:hypothetical protein
MRQRIGERDHAQHHGLEKALQLVDAHVRDGARCRATGVVDENVDPTQLVLNGGHHGIDEARVCQIAPHPIRLAAGRFRGVRAVDRLAVLLKPVCRGNAEAKAARGCENEGAFARKAEIHETVPSHVKTGVAGLIAVPGSTGRPNLPTPARNSYDVHVNVRDGLAGARLAPWRT